MTAQSWVETTLPPGYRALSGYRAVSIWSGGVDDDEDLGWECGGAIRFGFRREDERNRAAWRHWTAAVLRGRGDVRAKSYVASGGVQWNVALHGGKYWPSCWAGGSLMALMIKGGGYCLSSYDDESGEVTCRYSDDVDEAMARFAMLVMYDQGPVMNGDK